MNGIIHFLERSKKYTTETEDNSSESREIKLNKDGTPEKSRFNARKILAQMEVQRKKHVNQLFAKLGSWVILFVLIYAGHFFTAIFILWSASILHKEVISMGNILQKDQAIAFSWLDWYWYFVGAYICIPYAFLRQKITQSYKIDSAFVQIMLYQYHSLVSAALVTIGGFILTIKLNRGFVKYQVRRTLWTTLSLLYVFMLSTV